MAQTSLSKNWNTPKFQCRECGSYRSAVKRGDAVAGEYRRVRQCKDCGARFLSIERFERALPRTDAA